MKSKVYVRLILVILISPILMLPVNAYVARDACLVEVAYPKSKIYQTDTETWRFTIVLTVRNEFCSADALGASWFFVKIYDDGKLWWNEYNDTAYRIWRCNRSSTVKRYYEAKISTWNRPKIHNIKIELYWYCNGTPYLQDTTSFTVTLVLFLRLFPPHWTVLCYLFVYSIITVGLIVYLSADGSLKIPIEEKKKPI